MITYVYVLDSLRIIIGDSECPLKNRCPEYDLSNDCCASHRGRNEVGGERAECYKFFKLQIRSQKQGLASKVAENIMESLSEMEGGEN